MMFRWLLVRAIPGPLIARLAANMATLIWSCMVIGYPNAIDTRRFPAYRYMLDLLPENIWGLGGLLISTYGIYRICVHAPPRAFGAAGYAVQALFWNYLALAIFFEFPFPIPPATAAALIVVAALAVYAFASSARCDGTGDGHAAG